MYTIKLSLFASYISLRYSWQEIGATRRQRGGGQSDLGTEMGVALTRGDVAWKRYERAGVSPGLTRPRLVVALGAEGGVAERGRG